ncbi:non-ribosomal peptide synthetase [Westiellopsis prolifica IICB1]|nr:non-ribosomal peptide synthetase [Westiellopsis prolifica IICB1]
MIEGFELSPQQKNIWLLQQDSSVYRTQMSVLIDGKLNVEALQKAFQELVNRHEILRTTFPILPDMEFPVQVISNTILLNWQELDWSYLDAEEQESQVTGFLTTDNQCKFNYAVSSLFHVILIKILEQKYILIVTLPSLCADSITLDNLLHELTVLYSNKYNCLNNFPLQYVHFSAWRNELLTDEELELGRDYWHNKQISDFLNLQLPFEKDNFKDKEFEPEVLSVKLADDLVNQVEEFIQRYQISKSAFFLTAWKILLWHLTDQSDIVIGTNYNGRSYPELETTFGLLAQYLPIHSHLEAEDICTQLLQQVDAAICEAYSWQEYFAWDQIIRTTDNYNTLPPHLYCFDFQDYQQEYLADGVSFSVKQKYVCLSPFKIKLNCIDRKDSIDIEFNFNSNLFSLEAIKKLLKQFQTLIESILNEEKATINNLRIIDKSEQEKVLFTWNNTHRDYQAFQCLHQIFETQVEQTPDAVAVVFLDQKITYRELNQRANQLAHYLQKFGVAPEVLVGICMQRSIDLIIGLLAIFKAGGAYIPLDPSYPQERLGFMLADTQAPVLLTQQPLLDLLPKNDAQIICIDRDWEQIVQETLENPVNNNLTPDNLAYVIYTSGSTGKPKGVMNIHKGVNNRLLWMQETFQFTTADRFLQKTPLSFDISIWEIFSPFLAGASLVLAKPNGHQDSNYLVQLIAQQQITTVHFVPSMLAVFLNEAELEKCQNLKRVFCSGEALSFDLQESFFARLDVELHNLYGPTEASIEVTWWHCQRDSDRNIVPIGRPISNMQTYILDKYLRPVPIGVPGELHIAGVGVARGYLHRPDLTAQKFIFNPFTSEDNKLYKTGDLARYLPDGNIEYLGRIDDQVKIRGFRIELGEIEAVLHQHSSVSTAIVQAQNQVDEKRLVAYIVPHPQSTPKTSELRYFLEQKLPKYMVPAEFIFLKVLPLLSNGKIDRQALLNVEQLQLEPENYFVAPQTATQQIVADIWQQVLNLEKVGIYDNFFELGGHSLLAIQVISRLNKAFKIELPIRSLFDAPTVAELVEIIAQTSTTQTQIIPHTTRSEPCQLSFAQQRLWFLKQLESDVFAYNISTAVRLQGQLNQTALHQSFNEIVSRHEALRTSFTVINDQPVQVIASNLTLNLPVVDLRHLSKIEQEAEVQRLAISEAQHSFNLAVVPLLRVTLICLSDVDRVLLFTVHHIVFDGWSIEIFLREVTSLYQAFCAGKPSPLPELPIQYADFAIWQRQWLQGETLKSQLTYWQQQLAQISLLELPTDNPRPPIQSFRGASEPFFLPANLTEALKTLSNREGVTLFMTLLAAFKTLLYRYSGQNDVVVGSPIANRDRTELEGLIGFFVNTLVLRTDLSGNPTFRELLHRVRKVTLDGYAHQDLPFEYLVEKLQPERNLSHNPIFQIMFALGNNPMVDFKLPGLNASFLNIERQAATFDLSVSLQVDAEELRGNFEYNTNIFSADIIRQMVEHFQILLAGIVDNPDQHLANLPLLSATEEHQLLVEWNNTEVEYPLNQCIHDLFTAQVKLTPNNIAVVYQDQEITYHELNTRANQLARYLQKLGVGTEVLVGIYVERSIEMVIGLLGILKAGGGYVPLDPIYPQERLALILEDAQVSVLLTQEKLAATLPKNIAKLVFLDTDWQAIATESRCNLTNQTTSQNLAYVIFTSGSTGRPKGVEIVHSAVVNFLYSTGETLELKEQDILLSVTTLAFDIAVLEIFLPLTVGACVIVVSREVATNGVELSAWLNKSQATIMQATPATWQLLLEAEWQGNSQLKILCGGEAFPRHLANQLCQRCASVWNLYGPTETTIWSAVYKVEIENGIVPIGRPLANTQMYILDQHGQLVSRGVAGELHIGGSGLARGYLNQPELTAQKFIPNPFYNLKSKIQNLKLYKTGDLVRYLPNGSIEYLGRIDDQVKLRGFRIELGEIEAVLNQYAGVKQAVVLLNQQLVAYIVSTNQQNLTNNELRNFLKQKLPNYMIPSEFILLEIFPLTPNGKVDRRRLLKLTGLHLKKENAYVAPQSEIEQAIADIWQAVLTVEKVGIYDNFFDLGGHSLLLVRVFNQLQQLQYQNLSMMDLFNYPTINSLARYLSQKPSLQPTGTFTHNRRDALRQQRQRRSH